MKPIIFIPPFIKQFSLLFSPSVAIFFQLVLFLYYLHCLFQFSSFEYSPKKEKDFQTNMKWQFSIVLTKAILLSKEMKVFAINKKALYLLSLSMEKVSIDP